MEITSLIWAILIGLIVVTVLNRIPSVKYYGKFVVFYAYFLALGFFSLPFILMVPKQRRNLGLFMPYVQPLSKLLGLEWDVRGTEHLASDFPCVIIVNHQSCLDSLALGETVMASKTRNLGLIAKREMMYVFPPGFVAWLCGVIFIDRSNGPKAREKINVKLQNYSKDNVKIFIFPEGTRHKGPKLLPFKKGAFHIALQNKLPIVPVVISPYNFVNDEIKVFGKGKVGLSILEPITTESLAMEDVNTLVDSTHKLMNNEFERLCLEFKVK